MTNRSGGYKSDLRFILSREFFGMKLGLENISLFLNKIGAPQERFPSVHVAGTNGKGSTASYIETILRQAGYRTGIFTSPHLVDFRERIRVSGKQIDKRFISNFIRRHRSQIIRQKITFFEVCTALAFDYFARKKLDIAIIETGLGGRLDATNTVTPLVSVITDISFDHMHILGHTLRKIAFEKAGIIKENRPVITGLMPPEALNEIRKIARQRNAPLRRLVSNEFVSLESSGFRFDFRANESSLKNLKSSLPGEHQIKNAALAVKTALLLRELGYRISRTDIKRGLRNTEWDGRFQIIKRKGCPSMILDVAHNPAGVKAMVDCFRKVFRGKKAGIILGLVSNKDLKRSVALIPKIADKIVVVRLNTYRSAEPEDIARHLRGKGVEVSIAGSLRKASRRMIESSTPDDIIIICGSHYGVGEFLAHRKEIYGG